MHKEYGFAVVHIPHASIHIPPEYRETILLDDRRLQREIRWMTDAFCDELYDAEGFNCRVVATHSRLVCDVERFRDDKLERRARWGQGLMYVRTRSGRRLRHNDGGLRDKILAEIYDPHHAMLTDAVNDALERHGKCLIIDGHSFNSRTVMKPDNLISRPDFDIGTDGYHTPPGLCAALCETVRALGHGVKVNTPYGGAMVPMKFYRQEKNVISVMFEANRKLYMDEKTMTKTSGFPATRKVCHELMRTAAQFVVSAGGKYF